MTQEGYLLDTNICAFYLRGKYNVDSEIENILPIADAIDIAAKEKIRLRFHSASAPLNSFSSKRLAVLWKKLKFAGKKEVTE